MAQRPGLDLPTILEAATEIADTQGLHEITLASLARKLGIRSPSLYNHIDGLPGLHIKLTIYGVERLHHALTQAAVGRAGDDAIRAMAEAYITFARNHPGLYSATLSAPDPNNAEWQQASTAIVDLLVRVMQLYGLDEHNALHAVRIFRSLLHGFASLEQTGGFGLPLNIDTTLHLLTDTILAGIHAMQHRSSTATNQE